MFRPRENRSSLGRKDWALLKARAAAYHLAVAVPLLSGCGGPIEWLEGFDMDVSLAPTGGQLTVTLVPYEETACLTEHVSVFIDGRAEAPALNRGCGPEAYSRSLTEQTIRALGAGDEVRVRAVFSDGAAEAVLGQVVSDWGEENTVYDRIEVSHGEDRVAALNSDGEHIIDASPSGLEVPWEVRTTTTDGFLTDDAFGFVRKQPAEVATVFPNPGPSDHIQPSSLPSADEPYSVRIGQKLKTDDHAPTAECTSTHRCRAPWRWNIFHYSAFVLPREGAGPSD